MSRSSKSMRVGPRCGGGPPADAVAGAAGMEVEGATGSKAAFAADEDEALAGVAFADALAEELFDAVLLFPLLLLAALDLEADFLLVPVFFVAATADAGNAAGPASVDTSATTRSAVLTRMGRRRVNRTLWRTVNASINAIPLTNFVIPRHTCALSAHRCSRHGGQSP